MSDTKQRTSMRKSFLDAASSNSSLVREIEVVRLFSHRICLPASSIILHTS